MFETRLVQAVTFTRNTQKIRRRAQKDHGTKSVYKEDIA